MLVFLCHTNNILFETKTEDSLPRMIYYQSGNYNGCNLENNLKIFGCVCFFIAGMLLIASYLYLKTIQKR